MSTHLQSLAEEFNIWLRRYAAIITYGPRKAVAEVSNHKEPIGKRCAALMRKSNDVRLTPVAVQVAWLSNDFDRHLISGLLVHRFSDSSDLDVE